MAAPLRASAEVIDLDEETDKGQVIDLDEEGGKGAAAGPVVAGEPTEGFAIAKRAFDQEKWPEAAQGFFKVVSGETGDDPGNKQLAEFYLATSLYRLKFFQASFAIFSVIADNPSHLKFKETLLWLAKLATQLPEPADIIERVGKYSDEQVGRFTRVELKAIGRGPRDDDIVERPDRLGAEHRDEPPAAAVDEHDLVSRPVAVQFLLRLCGPAPGDRHVGVRHDAVDRVADPRRGGGRRRRDAGRA